MKCVCSLTCVASHWADRCDNQSFPSLPSNEKTIMLHETECCETLLSRFEGRQRLLLSHHPPFHDEAGRLCAPVCCFIFALRHQGQWIQLPAWLIDQPQAYFLSICLSCDLCLFGDPGVCDLALKSSSCHHSDSCSSTFLCDWFLCVITNSRWLPVPTCDGWTNQQTAFQLFSCPPFARARWEHFHSDMSIFNQPKKWWPELQKLQTPSSNILHFLDTQLIIYHGAKSKDVGYLDR